MRNWSEKTSDTRIANSPVRCWASFAFSLKKRDWTKARSAVGNKAQVRRTLLTEAWFQKQRGERHYGSYDWTFKKVFVNLVNEDGYSSYNGLTFQEMLDRIDEELSIKKSREEAKLEQAKQIFQKIKAELGNVSDYEVANYIKYMNDNRYSLYK